MKRLTPRTLPVLAAAATIAALASPTGAEILVGRWDVGVRTGTDLSNISGGPGYATDTASGLYGGVLVGVGVSPMIELESGVIYAQKGGKGQDQGEDRETNLNYITVPLRGRLPLGAGRVVPYFFAGIEFGFLLDAELTGGSATEDATDLFESFDFGTLAGVGLEIAVRKAFVLFEYSWARGLKDVVKAPDIDGKNNTSELVAGLKYRF